MNKMAIHGIYELISIQEYMAQNLFVFFYTVLYKKQIFHNFRSTK